MAELVKTTFIKNGSWPSGGMVNCLPLQAEMSELKSVNCGEALTYNDEGNPQPSLSEMGGRFRDYNHSVLPSNVGDDGIVQTTIAGDSESGKPDVVRDTIDSKSIAFGCASSSLASATIFYKLVTYDENGNEDVGGENYITFLMENCGQKLIDGHPSFKLKDPNKGKELVEQSERISNDLILESDLFFLRNYIEENYPQFKDNYKFVRNS